MCLRHKSNGIMRLIVSQLEIKAMSLCVIVSQIEDKSTGVMCKEEAKVRIVVMLFFLIQTIKRRFRSYPLELPGYKESISLCDTPKTKGHKKRMLLRKKHPQFQR